MEEYFTRKELGIPSNKDVNIHKITGIEIERFRSISEKNLNLGRNITVISGKNGTMKSTLMGLIAHPFDAGQNKDPFGIKLKTEISEIFKLSKVHDSKYRYYIKLELVDGKILREPIDFYLNKSDDRFRIVASGREKGDGNFSLNTSFINLQRLYPIVNTNATKDEKVIYSDEEKRFINTFYNKILQKDSFKEIEAVSEKNIKHTNGPINSYYDHNSISSGEDNLGHIVNKLLGFMRHKKKDSELSNGILCIDEFEASLHPVVQIKLFDYLYRWSEKHNVQIIITTHSLYLISHILNLQNKIGEENIALNIISTAFVSDNNFNIVHNPPYDFTYKELTLKDHKSTDSDEIHKIDVICEDVIAKDMIDKILKSREIKKYINYLTNLTEVKDSPGNSYNALISLCVNGPKLLENSIVIFDADVPDSARDKIKNFDFHTRLIDPEYLPIEKRIVKYIIELPGNDKFFENFANEKNVFLQEFADFEINIHQDDYEKTNIKPYKNWANNDIVKFKKYLTFYIRANEDYFNSFRTDFITLLNFKLAKKSLPLINVSEYT